MIKLKKNPLLKENPIPKESRPVKTPSVLQMESVECGAAALSTILSYYGKIVPLEKIRIACGVSRDGLKASNLLKAAKEYGLESKGYAKSLDKLKKVQMPAIIFWNFNHFLVLEGFSKDRVHLCDPAEGRYKVTYDEFKAAYTGVVLVLKPGEDFEKSNEKKSFMHTLGKRISGSQLSVVYIMLASLFLVIPGLVIPSFTKIFIDKYLVHGFSEFVMPLLLAMGGVLVINSLLVHIQQYYLLRLETKIALASSSKFLWHVLHLPMAFFSQRHAGEVGNRVSLNDKVAKLLSGDLANAALNVIVVIFYAVIMFSYDVLLTCIGLVMALLNILALRYVATARKEVNRHYVNESGKLLGTTISGINMIETLKASGRENDFYTNWTGYLAKGMNAQQKLGWLNVRLNAVPPLLTSINSAFILGFGAMQVMEGHMTLGMLVAFTYLMNNFMNPVNELVRVGALLQETEGDMGRIDDVHNYELSKEFNTSEEDEKPTSKAEKLIGHFEMKDISFGYSKTLPVLIENFNLKVKAGSRVALVGGSGSGKSTIAKLAAGLYEPWGGQILFDGIPREEVPRQTLSQSVAVIDQDVLMFQGSIQDNISFWDAKLPEKNIIQSAKDAAIHDVISARHDGYESEVMEGGGNFSGGQRQRLEIARALALNPSMLIMDEATSALDPKSEKIVMDNIRKRGCTCLIIAHRLSTIIDCDEIIVMEFGKVVERGIHSELIQNNGVYARLIGTL